MIKSPVHFTFFAVFSFLTVFCLGVGVLIATLGGLLWLWLFLYIPLSGVSAYFANDVVNDYRRYGR